MPRRFAPRNDIILWIPACAGMGKKDKKSPQHRTGQKNIKNQNAKRKNGLSKCENGIFHRDIKSGNIMVTANGRVKIVDFGLAKLADETRLPPRKRPTSKYYSDNPLHPADWKRFD